MCNASTFTVQEEAQDWYTKTHTEKTVAIETLRKEIDKQTIENKDLASQNETAITKLRKEMDKKMRDLDGEILQIDADLSNNNMKDAEAERAKLRTATENLKVQFEKDKKEGMIRINDEERNKIQAIRTLNEEMDYKIKEMQANMRAMNDEQL